MIGGRPGYWLRRLLHRDEEERLRREEMEFHLEMEAEKLERQGLEAHEARRRARLSFGGVERWRDAVRDEAGLRRVEQAVHGVSHAFRRMIGSASFSVVAVLSLAVGIGVNASLFSAVRALLLDPLPIPEPDRIVRLFDPDARTRLRSAMSPAAVEALDREGSVIEGAAGAAGFQAGWELDGDTGLLRGEAVTPGYFRTLRLRPAAGRLLGEEDRGPGAAPTAVLSHRFWREATGGSGGVIGATLRLNRRVFTVVGVAPEAFSGMNFATGVDVWISTGAAVSLGLGGARHDPWLEGVARLRPGATPSDAAAVMSRVISTLRGEAPDRYPAEGWFALPERAGLINPAMPSLVPLAGIASLGVGLLVLLVACSNVAGLALVRSSDRRREMAVRFSLGASRLRLVGQLVTEMAVIVVPAAALAFVAAWVAGPVFTWLIPPLAQLEADFRPDASLVAVISVCAVFAVLVAGVVPAVLATRGDLPATVTRSAGGRGSARPPRALDGLVLVQVAFAAVVLILGGLFVRTQAWYRAAEPGYAVEDRMAIALDVGLHDIGEEGGRAFYDAVIAEVRALPSVASAALAAGIAASGSRLELEHEADATGRMRIDSNVVGEGYFSVMRIPIAGRPPGERDRVGAVPVAVVNRTLAHRLFPEGAIGRTLRLARPDLAVEIVGVAEDVKTGGLAGAPGPFVYLPAGQHYRERMTLLIETADPTIVETVRGVVQRLEPGLPVTSATTVRAFVEQDRLLARAAASLGLAMGLAALGLAMIGLHSSLTFSVQRRRAELGVRKAIGASPAALFRMVLRRGALVAGPGIAAGVVVGVFLAQGLSGLLIGTHPADPLVIVGVTVGLSAAVFGALARPASRAARADPVRALEA